MKWKKLSIIIFISITIIITILVIYNKMAENTKIKIETNVGNITLELYPDKAPITVENFLKYVDDGFYNKTVFHRVIADFMIQGGGFLENGTEKNTNAAIKLESNNGLKNDKGTIAMARTAVPDSATSQFFINLRDNDFLNHGYRDEGYAVFGKVIDGMDVVETIGIVDTQIKHNSENWPTEEVVIKSIKRI